MRRFFKWVGYTLGTVFTLILLAAAGVYLVSRNHIRKDYPTRVRTVLVPTDSVSLARGRHIGEAIAGCANCHGDNLAGKVLIDNAPLGRIASSNLTSGRGGVAGGNTDEDWVRSIRHGVGTDARALVLMPSDKFFHMSDDDLGALIAWIKASPPVDAVMPPRRIGFVARALYLFRGFPLIPARKIPATAQEHRAAGRGPNAVYGKYLVDIGGCRGCHGDALSGGIPSGARKTPNLTPGGLGRWSEGDFVKAMRTGTRPDGRVLSAEMPWPYYRKMTDEELRALWSYLRSLPLRKTGAKG